MTTISSFQSSASSSLLFLHQVLSFIRFQAETFVGGSSQRVRFQNAFERIYGMPIKGCFFFDAYSHTLHSHKLKQTLYFIVNNIWGKNYIIALDVL